MEGEDGRGTKKPKGCEGSPADLRPTPTKLASGKHLPITGAQTGFRKEAAGEHAGKWPFRGARPGDVWESEGKGEHHIGASFFRQCDDVWSIGRATSGVRPRHPMIPRSSRRWETKSLGPGGSTRLWLSTTGPSPFIRLEKPSYWSNRAAKRGMGRLLDAVGDCKDPSFLFKSSSSNGRFVSQVNGSN
ncbi:hypothetical protein KSP39_PZI015163 [Platanthera zijinensis]|uniref:Uncharacterized protein n=1 Tax=Platanthera zijinensis TaxID=2320716 RepID=A0AAP0BAE7_9ASPA